MGTLGVVIQHYLFYGATFLGYEVVQGGWATLVTPLVTRNKYEF